MLRQDQIHKFWIPKHGNSAEEYEDASAFFANEGYCLRVALADGATESSFACEWAKMLVRAFRKEPFWDVADLRERMEVLSRHWDDIVKLRPLPWYAVEKARSGAFSTLLGLELTALSHEDSASGSWTVIAVGDTCLFHVRAGGLILAFPIQRSTDFGVSPVLLSSRLNRNGEVWERGVSIEKGDWMTGDVFIITTDALAAWFMHQHELGERPWETLLSLIGSGPAQFKDWVTEQRSSLVLKNDDVTCVLITT